MAAKIGSSVSCMSTSFHSPSQSNTSSQKLHLNFPPLLFGTQKFDVENRRNARDSPCQLIHGKLKVKRKFAKRQYILFASSKDIFLSNELNDEDQGQEKEVTLVEDISNVHNFGGSGGKPGIVSFYNHPYKKEADALVTAPVKNKNNLLWFVGPAVLVASFIFPSLYLRRMISTVFEDSLLTDFLILFFTEALFYFGVAMFLLIVDHLRRPVDPVVVTPFKENPPLLEYRITSVAVLVLSLVIPMVTMGFVWPWTGPAASATLAPYLVGIVVQFAFEQYAKYSKSPSLPLIPVIFQVYRLHQLNRAAQLVTALSFTVRGAEMTSHNMAINSSLGTLLNVLQCLGVICIWSLSSFLMKFLPSSATLTQQ